MIQLVTFADQSMSNSARLCIQSAAEHGVDLPRWVQWEQFKLTTFYAEHKQLFDQPRGLGYWAWKPWVILESMKTARDGDVVIYSDAGVEIIADVNEVVKRMDQDIHLFANQWQHAHWCKRDVIESICSPSIMMSSRNRSTRAAVFERDGLRWEFFDKQCQASVIFFCVSDYSKQFVSEWLDWCLIPHLIDDSPSIAPNHPEFREHRHDQAILTTLAYREGLHLHWWPARYNDGAFDYPKGEFTDDYPVMFHHHRRRNELAA